MDIANIVAFTVVAALLVMSPGPNGVLIAKTVPTSGRAAGFANVLGFEVGFFLHGALSILGISLLLVQSAVAFAIVKYLGVKMQPYRYFDAETRGVDFAGMMADLKAVKKGTPAASTAA